jgi:hypothetical protein
MPFKSAFFAFPNEPPDPHGMERSAGQGSHRIGGSYVNRTDRAGRPVGDGAGAENLALTHKDHDHEYRVVGVGDVQTVSRLSDVLARLRDGLGLRRAAEHRGTLVSRF